MYEPNPQTVLRCAQCNKPFDKESTLKRHGYYCRSRRVGTTPRSRACTSCARGKARCDGKRPTCSRCAAKGVACRYMTTASSGSEERSRRGDDVPIEAWMRGASDVELASDAILPKADDNAVAETALAMPDLEFESLERYDFGWSDAGIDFTNLSTLEADDKALQYIPSDLSSFLVNSQPWNNHSTLLPSNLAIPNITIPPIPTLTSRSIVQRPKTKNSAQRIADLILYTLTSYPMMMQRHKSLPPFIHPHLVSSGLAVSDREPLMNCISLVHMISDEVRDSRKLFWKMVRLECERLCEEIQRLNKWELLAAMQALSIYVLVRVDEGETEYNNFDFLLIATVTAVSKRLAKEAVNNSNHSALSKSSPEASWNEWIYEESKRRLCVVYQVVNLLVYFEPAAMCEHPSELILAPLPTRKQLWEASDETIWRVEKAKDDTSRVDFGLAANGDLVRLDGRYQAGEDGMLVRQPDAWDVLGSPANWQEWCSGMDEMGSLVMLAASFISV